MKTKKIIRRIEGSVLINIFFILCCFLALLPILYALSVSIDANDSILSFSSSM